MKELNELINYYQLLARLDHIVSIESGNKHNEEELKQTKYANAYSECRKKYNKLAQNKDVITLENLKNSILEFLSLPQNTYIQQYSVLKFFIKPLHEGIPSIMKDKLDIDSLNMLLFKYQNLSFECEPFKHQKLIKLSKDELDNYYQELNTLEKNLTNFISNPIFETRKILIQKHLLRNSNDRLYILLDKSQKLLTLIKASQIKQLNKSVKDKEFSINLINNMINSLNESITAAGNCQKINTALEQFTSTIIIKKIIIKIKTQISANIQNQIKITNEEFEELFNTIFNVESLKNTLDLNYKIDLLIYSILVYTTQKNAQVPNNTISQAINTSKKIITMINADRRNSPKKSIKIDTY